MIQVNYKGSFAYEPKGRRAAPLLKAVKPNDTKLVESLEEAIKKSGLKDGDTISFHHHFRKGDLLLNHVVDIIAKMGYKNLTLAASSLSEIHTPLIRHIENGVIVKIETSGLRGELAEAISKGLMKEPVIIRSHGGRARAIMSGDRTIDVAFLGVPSSDDYGNSRGIGGKTSCGSLGYAKVDAQYAECVIVLTDDLVDYPNYPASIDQTNVDLVVVLDKIGDSEGIASGATRFTKNPKELIIAENTAKIIEKSPYFKSGFTFQTGSGGASLAVTRFLKEAMEKHKIKMKFALGGITKPMVELYNMGLIQHMFDVQSFDVTAIESIRDNINHHEIDASQYANPHNGGCFANKLNVVVLSALEIDTQFNVNVITGANGVIRGASGGHSDTAASADLTVIVAPLIRGRIPTVVNKVNTIITPGENVDILVTERGIAINPLRKDLIEHFKDTNLPLVSIEELQLEAENLVGRPKPIEFGEKTVAVVEYRDGTVIDIIKNVI